jgi:nucleoid DNA-binding protein
MDKVWKLRQKVNSKSIYKIKQASLIFGKQLSHGDKIQKELLTSLGTKPQNKSELVDTLLNTYSKKNNSKVKKTIESNMDLILNYLKSHRKIKLISGKYHRVHKSSKRKKPLGKSKLRSVTNAKI